eukprot:scaffold65596_cov49-Phaeocystis_antarctica.AAC.2
MAIWLKAMNWRSRGSSTSSGLPRAGRCFHLEKTSGTPCLYTSSPICVNSPTTTSSITPHESGFTTAWPARARMSGSILSCRTSIAAAEKLSIMLAVNATLKMQQAAANAIALNLQLGVTRGRPSGPLFHTRIIQTCARSPPGHHPTTDLTSSAE